MAKGTSWVSLILLALWSSAASAAVLEVPKDFKTINDAMREARHGDTVLVAPGSYEGPVDIKNGVILRSSGGPDVTTIKGYRWWVVRLADADTMTAVIGFTVDGSKSADRVVFCSGGGSPRVLNNVIQRGWYGLACEGSSAIVRGNTIKDSRQGIYCERSSPHIVGCLISDNGKGVVLKDSNARLESNRIHTNQIGILVEEYSVPIIGGSLEKANDFEGNLAYNIQNQSLIKSEGVRTLMPALLRADYNFWGTECPEKVKFSGAVDYKPWVDKEHKKKLFSCP